MKRILSLVLVFSMLVCMLPAAYAEGSAPEQTEAASAREPAGETTLPASEAETTEPSTEAPTEEEDPSEESDPSAETRPETEATEPEETTEPTPAETYAVRFVLDPAEAGVEVRDSLAQIVFPASEEEPYRYALTPGVYTYSVWAEGFAGVLDQSFTVSETQEELVISVSLEPLPEETSAESGGAYADWTAEQILEEYFRLLDIGEAEPLNAFLAALSAEQHAALMAAVEDINNGGVSVFSGNESGSTVENARDITFGTEYIKTWNKDTDHLNCYNRIVLPEDGVLTVTATKPLDSYGKLGGMEYYLYDSSTNTVWGNETYHARDDGKDSYTLHVGLAAGTYYLTMKPGFYVVSGTITTNYTITFAADPYTERESNDSPNSATVLPMNAYVRGYLGADGASNVEGSDLYRFTAVAGETYSIRSDHFQELNGTTTMVRLIRPDGSTAVNVLPEIVSGGYSFTAASSGIHYLEVYNYSGIQIPYSLGVFGDASRERLYVITYNANGGSGVPSNQFKQAGETIPLSAEIPVRAGFDFQGWAIASGADTVAYAPGAEYSADADVTLYAVWKAAASGGTVMIGATKGTTLANAVNVTFGTSYVKTWTSETDHLNCYSRIVMPEDGILTVTATKPYDSDEYGSLDIYLYDAEGNTVWGNETYHAKSDSDESYRLFVGLRKGCYYMTVKPGFMVKSGTIETSFSLLYTADAFAEQEPNESAATATVLQKNHYYTGYLGNDGASNTEEQDFFSFPVTAGVAYSIRSDAFDQISATTAMIQLLYPNGRGETISSSMKKYSDASGYHYYNFTAAQTGICYLKVYNYGARQIPYSIGVFADTSGETAYYTIRYDANGGTGAPNPQFKESGLDVTLSEVAPVRNGYIFQGWATAQEAFAPEYQPGGAYTADDDLTLYAVWEQEVPSGSVVLTGNMGTKMSNAVDMQFGTRYTKSWNSSTDHLNCYNKITLTTGGILSIYASKPYDADEYGSLELYLYNSSGDLVWGNETYRAKADSHDYYALFVGLNKGTYYLTMKPGFIVKSGTIRTTYNVSFRADAYCEAEPNETASSATPMELNRSYFAFLGEDGANNTEKEDYFRFTVAGGRAYTIRSGCFAALGGSTIMIELIDPKGSRTSIANEMERNADADGNSYYSFVPEASGIYQIRLYNYSGRQISYSIGVFTEPPQEEQSYTVTYDPNGGAGAPANQRKTSDSRLRLSSVEPVRPGYRFLGWGTSIGSTMPEYMPGDLYDKDSDLSLFAIWEVQTAEGNRDLGSAIGYTTTSAAVDAAFGTGYTRGWTKSTYCYDTYHKLVVPENGVLSITAAKPFDSEKYGKLTFTLLDSSGNTVWGNGTSNAVDNSAEEYRLYVGLSAGTYYLSIKPGFSVTSGTITSSYSFLFTATDSAEKEPNESTAAATRMELNRLYLGYLGKDGANTEKEDYYSFDAVEGNNYTIVSDNYAALASSTAIIYIISPSGKSSSIGSKLKNQVNKDGRNYISFNALATGTYSLRICNYSAAQISYTIGVFEGVPEENEETYTVTYNANGGSGGIPRQTRTRDTQLILTSRIPERDQYTFQGWGLSANAKTPAYQPGDIYDQDKDITLYALWKFGCTNHQRDDGTVAKEPTCTEEGSTVYCCRICGEYLGEEPIPALGHDAVTDAAVAATCTDSGLTEGSHCARCGVTLAAQETVDALGHDPVEETPYPATCTQPGLAEGSHCARCGETLTHVEIPALGHTPVILPAAEPTCTQPGMTEGSVCQVCGDTLTEQLPLDSLGHDFAEGLCTRCGASDGVTPVSGTVGESTWRFDPATGYLTVTGGSVPDFGDPASAPWYGFAGDVTELILSDDVSAIGENAFTNLTGLLSVWIEGTRTPDIARSNTSLLDGGVSMRYSASAIIPDTITELDCSKQTGYELNIGFLPAGTQAQLRCSSSDETIARVDNEGRITLTGKLGDVVITVEDVHGIAAPVTMPIQVFYAAKGVNLALTAPIPANGLPVGEQAQLSVFAGEESIPAELAEFRVESGTEFVTVNDAGEITAVAPGTAAVRVTLRGNDPLNRTAVFHVRVTLAQAAQGFLAADAEGNMLDTAQGLYLQMSAAVTTYTLTLVDGEGQPLPVSGYTFAVSDTKVAKAAVAKNGTVTLTVPKNAAGACTVTATPKDKALKTAVVSLPVYVRDYTPRIDSTSLTMNSYMDCGVSTALVASYGNTIAGELRLLEKVKFGKTFVYQPCTAFTASVEGEVLTIATAEQGSSCPAGKYSLRLEIPGTLAESSLDLTLTVKNTLPKLTVKQTGKPNLFLTDAEGTLSVAAAGAVIRTMELDAPGYDAHDNGDGTMTLTRCEEAVAKKGTLTVYLEGYNTPCTANVSIGTVKTKPTLVLSSAAGTINAGERSDVALQVSQKGSTGAMDLTEGFRVSCTGDFTAELTDQGIRLIPGASVLHAAKKTTFSTVLSLTRDNWTGPVTLSYKLTVQPAAVLPTAKLAASSLTLNSGYPTVTADTVVTTDQQNMPVARVEAVCAKTDRIRLDYDAETGKITAALIGEAAPGSYPFTVQPYADDGRLLKPLKLTVKVINTAVTVTAKLTGKLDTVRPETGAATATLTVKNVTAPAEEIYALSPTGKLSATVVDGSALFDITMGRPDAKGQPTAQIRLRPDVVYSTKLTYSLRLACLLEGVGTVVTKDVAIKVTQSAVKAAAAPASLTVYQSQNTARTVTFRVSLTSPVGAGIRQIDLGTVNSLFRTSLADAASGISWNIDQDGRGATVRVTIRDTSRLKQGQKYILPLLITPEGNASNVAPVKLNVTLTVKK